MMTAASNRNEITFKDIGNFGIWKSVFLHFLKYGVMILSHLEYYTTYKAITGSMKVHR